MSNKEVPTQSTDGQKEFWHHLGKASVQII